MKLNKNYTFLSVCLGSGLFLTGCVTHYPSADQFNQATKVKQETHYVEPKASRIIADFNYQIPPAIKEAYEKYSKSGVAGIVKTKGFVAFPYDSNNKVLVSCRPGFATDIALEPGEKILNGGIVRADTKYWIVDVMLSGNGEKPVEHVLVKPRYAKIATNMVIGTNLRTYHIHLVSTDKKGFDFVKFWYPQKFNNKWKGLLADSIGESSSQKSEVIANVPDININDLNFKYSLDGDDPSWKPLMVFDDGVHTYIEFPKIMKSGDMPLLYVSKNVGKQLLTFRTKGPHECYYVIDGVYSQLVLIEGRGGYFLNIFDDRQQAVYITNEKMNS